MSTLKRVNAFSNPVLSSSSGLCSLHTFCHCSALQGVFCFHSSLFWVLWGEGDIHNNFLCILRYRVNKKLRREQAVSAPDFETSPSVSPSASSQTSPREEGGRSSPGKAERTSSVRHRTRSSSKTSQRFTVEKQTPSVIAKAKTNLCSFYPLPDFLSAVFIYENTQIINNLL